MIEQKKDIEMFYVHERYTLVSYLCLILNKKNYKQNV